MKISETWLREWVNPKLDRAALSALLTNSGFEIESVYPAAEHFSGVVVGKIIQAKKHHEVENLYICEVNVADANTLTVICGAQNVRVGMKVAVAKMNAVLPDNTIITKQTIRGVTSVGMLLSAKELGLSDENQTIIELSNDAEVGQDLWNYFQLDDYIFDVGITPNRGDCLSIKGFSREVSAITATKLHEIKTPEIKTNEKENFKVTIKAETECPHYIGRAIRNVNADAITPIWIKERLRRGGIRSINPIVDIVNYVMLELGQPMHAFDLGILKEEIIIRHAKQGENILLLDNSEKSLSSNTLVIADVEKPLAIAGVMGGLESSVTPKTTSIFLESAYFTPDTVAKSRQFYNLTSDSAYRYERGVDPQLQKQAIERVSQLILEVCGGHPGPLLDVVTKAFPQDDTVLLQKRKVTQLLGVDITESEIDNILRRLYFQYQKTTDSVWKVKVPSFRFDVKIPEDLVEEIGRLYGYDKIPTAQLQSALRINHVHLHRIDLNGIRNILADFGFQEVITYSFIDKVSQKLFSHLENAHELSNPITNDMSVMRTNLWSGLIKTLLYNLDRQQSRVKIFEIGKIFLNRDANVKEKLCLAGLISGLNFPEQWGIPSRVCDFYDIKGEIEMLFQRLHKKLEFRAEEHSALHPGQSAGIYHKNQKLGMLGKLHPVLSRQLDIKHNVFLYELDLDLIDEKEKILAKDISVFPEIRRDIAIVVNEAVPVQKIQDTINQIAGDWLKDNFIFDVYYGKGISSGKKSVALALILQHPTRTLTDAETADLMERVIIALKEQFGAELRS